MGKPRTIAKKMYIVNLGAGFSIYLCSEPRDVNCMWLEYPIVGILQKDIRDVPRNYVLILKSGTLSEVTEIASEEQLGTVLMDYRL